MGWGCKDQGAHPHWGHHLFCIPVYQPGPVWERQVNLLVTHCLPGEGPRSALKGGACCHSHQSKYFSAPTLTSIKSSQQYHTWLLIISHTLLSGCCSESWFWQGVGSYNIMQLSVSAATVFFVGIVRLWRLSFTWLFHVYWHLLSL